MIKRIYLSFPALNSLRAKVSHILLLFVTISLFLIIYNPFGLIDPESRGWSNIVIPSITIGAIFSGIAIIALVLYRKKFRGNRFTLYDYALMMTGNIVVCAILFSLGSTSILDYLNSIVSVFSITFIPYLLVTSFSIIVHLIKELIEKKRLLSRARRQEKVEMICFKDDNGNTTFYLDKLSILYIEANDNYVNIYFYASQKVSYKILRTSMKSMEALLKKHSIIRCHRSYLVNMQKINSIQKQKGQLKLSLYDDEFLVPVSRTFAPDIEQLLSISHLDELC